MRRASAPFIVVAVVVMVLAGYRLSRHDEAAAKGLRSPACLRGQAVARADLPAAFPVAKGMVLRSKYRRSGARVIQGYAPGTLRSIRDFYASGLSAKGFRLGAGDAERYEAETDFFGHGVRGHLKLNQFPGCPGGILVSVVTRPSR